MKVLVLLLCFVAALTALALFIGNWIYNTDIFDEWSNEENWTDEDSLP